MWQDVLLAVDHEHASEFVSTLLDDPDAPQSGDPPCKPNAKRKASETERSHNKRLASLFSRTEVTVLRFYQIGRLSQRRGLALIVHKLHTICTQIKSTKQCAKLGSKVQNTSDYYIFLRLGIYAIRKSFQELFWKCKSI